MGKYIFTSLVGHQLFGVINAIMCAVNEENTLYPISKIVLYPTADLKNETTGRISHGTMPEAAVIRNFCEEHGYPQVELIVTDRLTNNFETYIKEHAQEDESILFNAEGGMNYAVSQYVSALMKQNKSSALIITDGQYCHTVNLNHKILTETLEWDQTIRIPSLPPKEILTLQNTGYTTDETPTEFFKYISYWLAEDRCIPEDAMNSVAIGAVKADLLWNCGANHLAMLMSPGSIKRECSRAKNAILKRIRTISQWAGGKTSDKKFYDGKCYVLCETPVHIETIQRESRGKAVPIKSSWGYVNDKILYTSSNESTIPAELKRELRSILRKREGREHIPNERRTQVKIESDTLIMALGPDVASTVIAAASHMAAQQFKTIMLVYCAELEEKAAKVASSLKKLPGKPKLRRVIIDTKGRAIPFRLRLADDAQRVEVNISPGTKGQTAYLTCFAMYNKLKIWSLATKELSLLEPADLKISYPVVSIDPLWMLDLDDKKISSKDTSSINFSLMTDLLREFKKEETKPADLERLLSARGYSIIRKANENEFRVWNFKRNEEKKLGFWFEELTFVALSAIKNSKCHLGFKLTDLDYRTISEIDCLCGYSHLTVAVSCKAYLNYTEEQLEQKIKNPLREVVAYAKAVSRFCLPVLCLLNKNELPAICTLGETRDKVAIIDLKDLADPETLIAIFNELDEQYKFSPQETSEQEQAL